jgi:PAS domain S-box-containing protein
MSAVAGKTEPAPAGTRRATPEAAALADAFVTFEHASLTLAAAYERLEGQFRRVNRELERANRDLARSYLETEATRRLLDRVLSCAPCGILSCDLGGVVTMANTALTTMLGRAEGSLQGALYDETLGGWDDVATALRRAPSARAAVSRERSLRREDGTLLAVESTLSPLLDADGGPAGVVEIVKDLSEMQRLEEAVREARTLAALGEMAAGLAHEVRNPLGGIKGFTSLLARDLPADDPRSRTVRRIADGVDAVNTIVTDFLAFGAPGRPAPRAFDARALVSELLALLEAEGLARPGVAVEASFPDDTPLAYADRDQVRQALLNILRNAFEATPGGGRIRLAVTVAGRALSIAVADSGPGIPDTIRARLFRPFGSTKPGGTGLGLAVARALVEGNAGALEIASDASGTTATLRLPARRDGGAA